MSKLRMLAASARPVADVLIDILRKAGKPGPARAIPPDEDRSGTDQFSLQLDVESREKYETRVVQVLHPDEAAAAVLLGQAFEHSRDALLRLLDPDSVVIIEVSRPDLVEPIARLLRKHVFGPETPLLDGDSLEKQPTAAVTGTVIVFKRSNEARPRKALAGGFEFAAAVQLRCPIVAIAADLKELPKELVSLAGSRILVPALDGAAIATVIRAVTGRNPGAIDEDLARRVTLEMLSIAVRADLGAKRSMARLRRLADEEAREQAIDGPLLSEMHGLGPAKQFGLDLVADFRSYIAGKLPWSACPKGLLLSGPPGTGKTSFARALARELGPNVHFTATSYSAWQSHKDGHLGSVTAAIRKTFADARIPGIVFIDEIGSLPARGADSSDGRNNLWFTAVVNCLLEELDGFSRREGIFVVAACNDPSRLDSALLRAGRLDHHIIIPLPDVNGLVGIFRTHLGADLTGSDLRAAALAARGHSGADVERWVRLARRAARAAGRTLNLQDLLDAVRGGEPEWPVDVRRRIAYHEAGHAIALLALRIAEPRALSIGGSGGLAESNRGEMRPETRSHLEKFLVALLPDAPPSNSPLVK